MIAHRGRLAGAVGTEEAGHPTGLADEADVVDGGEAPYFRVSPSTLIMASSLPDVRRRAHRPRGRSRRDQSRGGPPTAGSLRAGRPRALACGVDRPAARGVPAAADLVGPRVAAAGRCWSISAVGWLPVAPGGSPTAAGGARRRRWASSAFVLVLVPAPLAAAGRGRRRRCSALVSGVGGRPRGAGRGLARHPPPLARDRRWSGSVDFAGAQFFTDAQPGNTDEPCWLTLTTNAVITVAAMLGWGMYIGSRRELLWTLRHRAERAEAEQELRVAQARGQRAGPDRPRDARRAGPPDLPGLACTPARWRFREDLTRRRGAGQRRGDPASRPTRR